MHAQSPKLAPMPELRGSIAIAGSALMALGIGLVILANPSGSKQDASLNWAGWVLVALGTILLLASVLWTIGAARRRPKVVIVCGNEGENFRRPITPEGRHLSPGMWGVDTVHMTRLLVREMNDVRAPAVHLQVVSAIGSTDDIDVNRPGLQWVNGEDAYDLPPRGRGFVRLCERVEDAQGIRVLTSVPLLAPGNSVTFGIATIVNGERVGKRQVFLADWSDKGALYPEVSDG